MAPAAIVSDIKLADNVPETNKTAANAPTNYLFSLRNKTILITGGGRGLGITLAAAVIESGGNAACLDILPDPSPEEWGSLQRIAKLSGLRVSYYKCDITQEADLSRVIEEITEEGKRIRAPFAGAIACAGVQQKIPALDYPMEDFSRILHINVTGTFLTAKYAARSFVANNIKGSIVMIASMSGDIANRGLTCTAYNTSKSAVHQMCRSVAQEWGQYGIRVNTLSPGVNIAISFMKQASTLIAW